MTRGKEAIAVWRAARSVTILTIIMMSIRTSLTKDSSSHRGPNTAEDRATKAMITSIETETKAATTMDTGEDAMKEVEADLKKHRVADSSIKGTTQCKTASNQLLLRLTAAKCTGNRISRGCSKVSCYRNKLDRWYKDKTLTNSNSK